MTISTRPLVVTADGPLLDELLAVTSAAGVAVDVAMDLTAARPQWTSAPLILVGSDAAPGLSEQRLPRRTGVVMVHGGPPPGRVPAAVGELVALPRDEARLLELLAGTAEPGREAVTVGVVAGCGGAGASTLAAALALTAAGRDGPAWLIDLDELGGGADAVLGAELTPGVRWGDLAGAGGRISAEALRDAAPAALGVSVVACDDRAADGPEPAAVHSVLESAAHGGGTVVVDLPRHRTPARDEALPGVDRLVVVVPAEVRAVLATRRVVSALGHVPPRVDLVVRTAQRGLPAPEVSRALGLPLAGVLPDEPQVRMAGLIGSAQDVLTDGVRRLCGDLLSGTTTPVTRGRAA